MSEIETLGILEEIQALVSDHLQVVSYKWLSHNFLLPSNAAKRLLQEFVEKHGSGLEVVYALSGWLKSASSSYHIRLVSGPKLAEAKQDFDANFSVQVYSVQACLPRDPAALWNAEFVQAEELFKQSSTVDNCLTDNRFSGISNSFVKHNIKGQPNIAGISGLSKSNYAHQNIPAPPQQIKIQQSSPKVGLKSSNVVKDIKSESNGNRIHDQAAKSSADKEKVSMLPTNKKKVQSDKITSGNGGSLANMWGRASTKSKTSSSSPENNNPIPNPNVDGEAQICASEAAEDGCSDDDGHNVNFKRTSNGEGGRKRRVVFDFSDDDEYEDAVNLASPELPERKSCLESEQNTKTLVSEEHINTIDKIHEGEPKAKDEKGTDSKSNQLLRKKSAASSKGMINKISSLEKESCISGKDVKVDKLSAATPNSPKRRRVMKTRIDDRGREVTEVVWEGEEVEAKKAGDTTDANTINRPPAAKKSTTVGSNVMSNAAVGKAGNKKAGNPKDPKQGNILSFFKRV